MNRTDTIDNNHPDYPHEPRYLFYVETEKHGYCAWDCLTLLEAKKMYNLTKKRYALTADDIKRYGWEEMK